MIELIQRKIDQKPLILYLNGKLFHLCSYVGLDSVRNVIESGEVFTEKHLDLLEGNMDDIDIKKPEVVCFFRLVRGYLTGTEELF